jgi:hypothetical protein
MLLICTKVSPHTGSLHDSVHAPVLLLFAPRSQASPGCLKPSPQVASLHTLVQASSLLWLPSSQASPGPLSPSPQTLSCSSPCRPCRRRCWPRRRTARRFAGSGCRRRPRSCRSACTRRCCCCCRPGRTARPCSSAAGRRRTPAPCRRRCSRRRCCRSCRRRTLARVDDRVAALPRACTRRAAVAARVVAVVALLVRPEVAVAAHVELHIALQALPGPFSPRCRTPRRRRRCCTAPRRRTRYLAAGRARALSALSAPSSHSSRLPPARSRRCTPRWCTRSCRRRCLLVAVVALLGRRDLPVAAARQRAVVAALVLVVLSLPSSQPSPGPTFPSPQTLLLQSSLAAVHVAVVGPVVALLAGPMSPSPQVLRLAVALHGCPGPLFAPSSQSSPASMIAVAAIEESSGRSPRPCI